MARSDEVGGLVQRIDLELRRRQACMSSPATMRREDIPAHKTADVMRHLLYYALMLLGGFVFYKYGQRLLRQGYRDENGELSRGMLGPFGFVMATGLNCFLFFALLRALVRREVQCLGKGCNGQLYTLAANAAEYGANMFYLLWMVLGLSYAMYVTFRLWFRN